MLKLILAVFCALFISVARAESILGLPDPVIDSPDFVSVEDILNKPADETECATAVFANALAAHSNEVNESDDEIVIQTWIHKHLDAADVLTAVLACPELIGTADEDHIKFMPIEYTFPGGRHIVVNYETQPRILKQRLVLANKQNLPDDPNPRIGAAGDTNIWTHTDPAWYGIIVAEAGSLDEFVGPGKNNTVSLRYINDNIDRLYPQGSCTNETAWADDEREINKAGVATVGIGDDDSNDYYVAGDASLEWVSWAEIALDVVISVATMGAGAVALGSLKGARAVRALKTIKNSLQVLRKEKNVQNYIKASGRLKRATEELKNIDRVTDAAKYKQTEQEIKNLNQAIKTLEKDKQVVEYRKTAKTFEDLNKYRNALRGVKIAQRGNVVARGWRAFKAANTGNKLLRRGAKVARSSMKSGKIRDWLYHSTLKNIGKVAKVEEASGFIYGAINVVGDMYDRTESSTGDFTSGIDFKPLLLLSADDIKGQENVVNYGMWLLWAGDSIDPSDDDAAYLQAMDFAEKFYQELVLYQDDHNSHDCNVDIYVVRPVIRNPGDEDAQLYYLIMNDEPWSTRQDTTNQE